MLWNFSSGGGDSLFVLCKIEIGPFSICDARRMHPTALSHTPILSRFLWFQELNYSATFVHVVLQVNAAELCFSWNCWSSSSQRRESRVTQECNSNITPSWRRREEERSSAICVCWRGRTGLLLSHRHVKSHPIRWAEGLCAVQGTEIQLLSPVLDLTAAALLLLLLPLMVLVEVVEVVVLCCLSGLGFWITSKAN